MMISSSNELVKSLAELMPESKKRSTVTSDFKSQLHSLMISVRASDPHFVRCLKPNPKKQADYFDRDMATEQLRCGGVVQAVEVSRSGYAVRVPHELFWESYRHILPELEKDLRRLEEKPAIERARGMLQLFEAKFSFSRDEQTWDIGHTLVFLKQPVNDTLAELCDPEAATQNGDTKASTREPDRRKTVRPGELAWAGGPQAPAVGRGKALPDPRARPEVPNVRKSLRRQVARVATLNDVDHH
jgi:myosin heavy subunit